jgi:hypothetical protein
MKQWCAGSGGAGGRAAGGEGEGEGGDAEAGELVSELILYIWYVESVGRNRDILQFQ